MINLSYSQIEQVLYLLERAITIAEAHTAHWELERAREDEKQRKTDVFGIKVKG